MEKRFLLLFWVPPCRGATFVQLLANHPWFEITALVGSKRSANLPYHEACNWRIPGDSPESVKNMTVSPLSTNLPVRLVFSALPSEIAREWEPNLHRLGMPFAPTLRHIERNPMFRLSSQKSMANMLI